MGEILFLAHRVPWPPNRGDKIRSHHILRKLIAAAPVHIACFADDVAEAKEASELQDQLASCYIEQRSKPQWKSGLEALFSGQPVSLAAFASSTLSEHIENLVRERDIDCIFAFSGQMAQYVPADFAGRFIMDFVDVDSAKFESYGKDGYGPMAWIHRREGTLLKAFEKDIANRADRSLFVSSAEAEFFCARSGVTERKIMAIGNGIALDHYDPSLVETTCDQPVDPLIVFTGQMDYRPNIEAVDSFARDVMPAILKKFPNVRFAIVGRAPGDAVRRLDGLNGTMVIGAVDDVREWLANATIVVAPLRIARGIQNKVLEAMAMAKPVVASKAAAEGIEANDGQHLLVADDIDEEARLIIDLLRDPAKINNLGEAARNLILSQYSWDQQLVDIPALCGADYQAPLKVLAVEETR